MSLTMVYMVVHVICAGVPWFYSCQVILHVSCCRTDLVKLFSQPTLVPCLHVKCVIDSFASTVFFSVVVPGGRHSQGCDPVSLVQVALGLHNPFRHYSPHSPFHSQWFSLIYFVQCMHHLHESKLSDHESCNTMQQVALSCFVFRK